MWDELKTGNEDAIIDMFLTTPHRVERKSYYGEEHVSIIFGENANVRRLEQAAARGGDDALCAEQARQFHNGADSYTLGSNVYGWAVGSMLRMNLCGGRWAVTSRGISLEDAIRRGIELSKQRDVTFTISIGKKTAFLKALID
jgi:hypothetical protein